MARVTRKRLGRGVELTVNQVFDPISGSAPSMKTELEGVDISVDQRQDSYGVFRLNFNIPWIGSKYFHDNRAVNSGPESDSYDAPYYIPFCLPPTQEFFDIGASGAIPTLKEGAPVPVLQELSFSFDQGDEPGATAGHWAGREDYNYNSPAAAGPPEWVASPYQGRITYNRHDAYDTTITLYEKDQTYFSDVDSIADALRPKAEVFSVSFKGTTFTARQSRTNPVVVPDISRQLSPFKTYVLAVYCPNLHDVTGNDHCVMNNIWLSLRFRSRLVARDEVVAADVELQNVPVLHKGGHTGPLIPTSTPALAENLVIADGQDSGANEVGISTNLQAVDEMFSAKLRGGYQDFSQAYPSDMLEEDASYEVIAVNLGAGFPLNRMSAIRDYRMAPYVSDFSFNPAPVNNPTFAAEYPYVDRRIIPIDNSLVIHHVIAAMNWSSDKLVDPFSPAAGAVTYSEAKYPVIGAGVPSKLGGVEYGLGLGMMQGLQADNFSYQQIAYAKFTQDNIQGGSGAEGAIDAIKMGLPACGGMEHEWKLMSVPIRAQSATPTGKGYWGFDSAGGSFAYKAKGFGQGTPWFVGEGNTYTADRTDVGKDDSLGGISAGTPFNLPLLGNGEGCESFLEIRMSVTPTQSVFELDPVGGSLLFFQDQAALGPPVVANNYSPSDVFIGYGGCWVYIICKKHLK